MIRLATPSERDLVLDFIGRSGTTARDAATWNGLDMTAMTAWDSSRLIGVIPLEPRQFQTEPGTTVRCVHQTCVAVEARYRGSGIGSQMQDAILAEPPAGAAWATVFREEPGSPAHRWYLRNGFVPAMSIRSWFRDAPRAALTSYDVVATDDARVTELRRTLATAGGGFVDRASRPIGPWLAVHPYRHRYRFEIVASATSYALLGIGRLHSDSERVDVLEFASSIDDRSAVPELVAVIEDRAATMGWHPVRWPIAATDPLGDLVQSQGYVSPWHFDFFVRRLSADAPSLPTPETRSGWRYQGIDYI